MRELLVAVPGVQQAKVDYDESLATVDYDSEWASIEDLSATLAAGGYRSWSTTTETRQPTQAAPAAIK